MAEAGRSTAGVSRLYHEVMLRPYTPDDAAAFLVHENRATGHDRSLERFLSEDSSGFRRQVAVLGGQVVGAAQVKPFVFLPPGWRQLHLSVAPEARGRGLGSALLTWAQQEAVTQGAPGLGVDVLDHDPQNRLWAERRGFALHAHRFASELDLSSLDLGRDAEGGQPAPPLPEGVTLRDMQGATSADWDRLEALYGDLLTQTPDLEDQPRWTPEQLRAHVRDHPRARPDWTLLAVGQGNEWLGLCQGASISTGIYNELTAVVPSARGQGLARALKLELIARARQAGLPLMRTHNHAANAAMLSVNARLGFVAQTGSWEMRRKLT